MNAAFVEGKYGFKVIMEERWVYDNIPAMAQKRLVLGMWANDEVYKYLTMGMDGKPLMNYKYAVKERPVDAKEVESQDTEEFKAVLYGKMRLVFDETFDEFLSNRPVMG